MVLSEPAVSGLVTSAATPVPTALWAIPVANLAGVARHVVDVTRVGVPGWRVVVLCPPGPLADVLREQGAAVFTDTFGPEAGPAASVVALRRAVRHLRPAVVHTHLAYADLIAAAVPRDGFVRISTEHGVAADDAVYHAHVAKARVMAEAHHLRQRRLDGQVAVSHATLRTLRDKWRPGASVASEVIPNGVDRGEHPVRDAGLHVGSICRLAPEKGLDVLLDAFAVVVAGHPEARLTVAGDGPLAADLVAQAARLGLAEAVRFPGFVDADALLAECDVVVQLSVWENASYALLDALRAGCGVVATAVGGNPEMLPSDALVARGDVTATAAAITAQGLDPSARPRLVDDWPTVADMTDRLGSFYDRVVAAVAR